MYKVIDNNISTQLVEEYINDLYKKNDVISINISDAENWWDKYRVIAIVIPKK